MWGLNGQYEEKRYLMKYNKMRISSKVDTKMKPLKINIEITAQRNMTSPL